MRKLFLTVSFILSLLLVSCDQLNRELSTGDIQVDFPGTSSRTIYSSTTNKEYILEKPENAIFRLYLIDEKGFTVTSTVGKPGGTAVFNNIKEGLYTLKCYYGLSASKTNAVAAAYSSVTVRAGETANVTLDLSYNRSNLIEKVNVEWAGNNVFYGSQDYLDDYIKKNTLIDFYLSNGWNESFLATDTAIKSFCHIENDLIDISKEHIDDTSFRVNIKFHYRKTPDSEILEESNTFIITLVNDPLRCPDWATLQTRINSVQYGGTATFILFNETYLASTPLTIPEGRNITLMVDENDVTIKPENTSMAHLVSISNNAFLTIDGEENMLTLNGRYNESRTFTGSLILVNSYANLTVQNNVFFENAGTNSSTEAAAIAVKENGTCIISEDVSFDRMYSVFTSSSSGGAISNFGELTISNASFTNCRNACENEDSGGGAIFSAGSKLQISGTSFNANSSTYGSAIYIASGTNNVISNCTFTNNQPEGDENVVYVKAGAECTKEECTIE